MKEASHDEKIKFLVIMGNFYNRLTSQQDLNKLAASTFLKEINELADVAYNINDENPQDEMAQLRQRVIYEDL